MVKIAICDDDKLIHEEIRELCLAYGRLNNVVFDFMDFFSAEELISYEGESGIIFMDIEMEEMSGLEAKNFLQKRNGSELIIFITSHTELMPEAFGRNVCGFLSKPINTRQFNKIFEQALYLDIISFKINVGDSQNQVYVCSDEIVYIKSDHVYSEVITENASYLMRKSLDKWEKDLNAYGFYRISKSYIINMSNISNINETVIMKNGEELNIPRGTKKKFVAYYKEYCKKMARYA